MREKCSLGGFARWRIAVFGLILVALVPGCGPSVGQVQGKITFKQQPVTSAELLFLSEANPDQQFSGIARPDGTYQVSYRTFKGLPVGRYSITITRHVLPGGKALPEGEKGAVLKQSGQALKETYVFEKDIAAGANTLDFELQAGKKIKE